MVGGVFEGDEVEFGVGGEVGAGEDAAVFEEGQEGFFEVVLVGGVLRSGIVFSGCDWVGLLWGVFFFLGGRVG